jgi:hypothetical protein
MRVLCFVKCPETTIGGEPAGPYVKENGSLVVGTRLILILLEVIPAFSPNSNSSFLFLGNL